jgi:AraC-like DNA-binding protein/Tfp pilus assembly protein PilF
MKILIVLFLFIIAPGCFEGTKANNIDSLKNKLKFSALQQDSLVILKALTKSYQSISIDSTFYYGQIAIGQAGKLNDTASLADVYNYLGTACYYVAFYERALGNYQKSKELIQSLNDNVGLAKIYNNIGIIYEVSGKNDIALEHYYKSLEIWNGINEQSPDDPETKKIIALLYNNIGIANYKLGETEKALEYYNKSLSISSEFKEKTSMSLSLHNIGIVHSMSENYDKAQEYLFQSLEISRKANDKQGIATSLNEIGDVYLKIKNYKEARKCFNEGLRIAKIIQANELIMHAYRGLYLLNEMTGDYELAFRYQTLYHQLNDSIYSQESKNKMAGLQNKYEFEKKEQKIKLLEAEQELNDIRLRNSRTWLFILIGGISIAVILLIVIYYEMMQKVRANKELVKRNLEIVKSENYYRNEDTQEQDTEIKPPRKNILDKYAESTLSESYKNELKSLIEISMENEKHFLKRDFTIEILSKHINTSRSYVSQVINEKFNMHFNSFINEYRIKEARRLISDPNKRHLTIETIAREVGFGSKSTFNVAFKKYTGITPSFFYRSLKN